MDEAKDFSIACKGFWYAYLCDLTNSSTCRSNITVFALIYYLTIFSQFFATAISFLFHWWKLDILKIVAVHLRANLVHVIFYSGTHK